MIGNFLMRIARAILQNVLQQLNQLFQQIEEQAMNVLKAIIAQVVAGSWKGTSAEKFVDEVSSLAMPGVGKALNSVSNFGSGIQKAQEIMDNAENQALNMIKGIVPAFKFL